MACWPNAWPLYGVILPGPVPQGLSIDNLELLIRETRGETVSRIRWMELSQILGLNESMARLYWEVSCDYMDGHCCTDLRLSGLLLVLFLQSLNKEDGGSGSHGTPRAKVDTKTGRLKPENLLAVRIEEEGVVWWVREARGLATLLALAQHREGLFREMASLLLRVEPGISHLETLAPQQLVSWVERELRSDLSGVLSTIKGGKRLHWDTGACKQDSRLTKAKMATNAHLTDREKLIVISQLQYQTLAKRSPTLEDARVYLHRARHSFVYLVNRVESIVVSKCSNSKVFCGPVKKFVYVIGCRDLALTIAWTSRLVMKDCLNCSVHFFSPREPVISGNKCYSLVLAPLNTSYVGLERDIENGVPDHLLPAFVSNKNLCSDGNFNKWDRPIVIQRENPGSVSFLYPRNFFLDVLPFPSIVRHELCLPVPQKFEESLEEKNLMFSLWKETRIQGGKRLESEIGQEFSAFLSSRGLMRELCGLTALKNLAIKNNKPIEE